MSPYLFRASLTSGSCSFYSHKVRSSLHCIRPLSYRTTRSSEEGPSLEEGFVKPNPLQLEKLDRHFSSDSTLQGSLSPVQSPPVNQHSIYPPTGTMSGEPSPPAATGIAKISCGPRILRRIGQNASASEPGMTPPRPPDATRSGRDTIPTGGLIGPLGYSGEDPEERERRLRWGPPPDDWRSYWDRKRHERDWYPDYSGPQRYPNDDYYEPPRSHAPPRSSGVYRSGSMRERGPPVSYRTGRYAYAPERGSFEREREARPRGSISARTPKDDVEEYYDSEEDITYARRGGAGGGGGRGGGQGPLPTDGSEGMRYAIYTDCKMANLTS